MAEQVTDGTPVSGVSTEGSSNTSGQHLSFSAEERGLPEDLLGNSHKFVGLYEEHQPELQQLVHQLLTCTEMFLDHYGEARTDDRGGSMWASAVPVAAGVGVGLGFVAVGALLASVTTGVYLGGIAGNVLISALGAGSLTAIGVFTMYTSKKKYQKQKEIVNSAKKTMERFKATAGRVTSALKIVCTHIEKMLQHLNKEDIRKSAGGFSELAELFKQTELLGLSKQGARVLEMTGNIQQFASPAGPLMKGDHKTLRDINKLKILSTVQENELESAAGRLIWKMRERVNHLQDTLNEMRSLKCDIQKMILPKLTEFLSQQNQ